MFNQIIIWHNNKVIKNPNRSISGRNCFFHQHTKRETVCLHWSIRLKNNTTKMVGIVALTKLVTTECNINRIMLRIIVNMKSTDLPVLYSIWALNLSNKLIQANIIIETKTKWRFLTITKFITQDTKTTLAIIKCRNNITMRIKDIISSIILKQPNL